MAPTNKQWVSKLDGVDKLEFTEGEVPVPKDGEVLVKIHTVSLNYRDIEVCEGEYTHHSFSEDFAAGIVPCSDMCGTVIESKSPLLSTGTRVMSIFAQAHLSGALKPTDLATALGLPLPGVLTEYRCFDAKTLVKVPEYLTDEEASCLPIASVTAWMALNWMRPIGKAFQAVEIYGQKPEEEENKVETVLLQGTGGVSIAGLQIAKAARLKAIITSSSDEKLEEAKKLGADHTINYRTYWEWQDRVLEATSGNGADYIVEVGGAKTLRKSFESVAFGGTISCIGYVSGKEDDNNNDGDKDKASSWNKLNVNVLALRRNVTLKGLINGGKDRFEEMVRFYEEKQIRPAVCKVFGLEEAKEAMGYVQGGKHFGKVVIKVA
ncbi:hypothetical protein ACQKWADRAFT_297876 [Trichoderma austrokoningii]